MGVFSISAHAAAPIFRIKALLDKGQVLVDGGSSVGLEAGDVLFVHDDQMNLGRVTISRVTETEAYATITDQLKPGSIAIGNFVEFEPIREKVIDASKVPVEPGIPLSSPVREAETLVLGARYSPSKLQELDEKIKALKQQINLGGPDPRLYVELGEALILHNDLDGAINWLKQGVQLDDKSDYVPRGLYRIAQAYVLAGRNDRSVRYLNFITANYPNTPYNKTLNQTAREAREMFETYSLDQALLEPETRLERGGPTRFATSGMTRMPTGPAEEPEERVEKKNEVTEAPPPCPASVDAIAGEVKVTLDGGSDHDADIGECLFGGDKVSTGTGGGVVVLLSSGDALAMYQNSTMVLKGLRRKDDSERDITGAEIQDGEIWAEVETGKGAFDIATPSGVVNVRGTKFFTKILKLSDGSVEVNTFARQGLLEMVDKGGNKTDLKEGMRLDFKNDALTPAKAYNTEAFDSYLNSWLTKLERKQKVGPITASAYTGFLDGAGKPQKGPTEGANPEFIEMLDLASQPSLLGIGGLHDTPTAVVRPMGQIKAGVMNFNSEDNHVDSDHSAQWVAASFAGKGNIELGISRAKDDMSTPTVLGPVDLDVDYTTIGVKFLTQPKANRTRYGFAATYTQNEVSVSRIPAGLSSSAFTMDGDSWTGWAFARWARNRYLLHAGLFMTEDNGNNAKSSSNNLGFFLSYAQQVGDKGLAFAEFITSDSDDALNLGYRHNFSSALSLEAVAKDILDTGSGYSLGLRYGFGGDNAKNKLGESETP